ncbi:hypothetical protein Lqui_2522 [Legionella quinlivanii]|uniref:Uncharacterized protein n=1 Tax=Legionella quinlivanii TaxID=45073 RepID=A0A0W0XPT5_9GAMM|nr:hypothetical protein [Legionella quinlivanii]KTD46597.1 hypothetical protein Lqui_2522 [Legionella quinlivanii]MCW8451511.1 hypothetical protein [Legionella quinlivanii]SEG08372.1 hypothetical protein SAMN02746093_01806 [Legionella quinlivanii DSM 21216]STY10286.1 Uncharacterised protein [Legionella quinlivanii]
MLLAEFDYDYTFVSHATKQFISSLFEAVETNDGQALTNLMADGLPLEVSNQLLVGGGVIKAVNRLDEQVKAVKTALTFALLSAAQKDYTHIVDIIAKSSISGKAASHLFNPISVSDEQKSAACGILLNNLYKNQKELASREEKKKEEQLKRAQQIFLLTNAFVIGMIQTGYLVSNANEIAGIMSIHMKTYLTGLVSLLESYQEKDLKEPPFDEKKQEEFAKRQCGIQFLKDLAAESSPAFFQSAQAVQAKLEQAKKIVEDCGYKPQV